MVGGRKRSSAFAEYHFELTRRSTDGKYEAVCQFCGQRLQNTAAKRLKMHRNKCTKKPDGTIFVPRLRRSLSSDDEVKPKSEKATSPKDISVDALIQHTSTYEVMNEPNWSEEEEFTPPRIEEDDDEFSDNPDEVKLKALLWNFNMSFLMPILKEADVTYRSLRYLSVDDINTAIRSVGYRAEFREKLFAWRRKKYHTNDKTIEPEQSSKPSVNSFTAKNDEGNERSSNGFEV